MNRDEREQALWHDAYMLAMSQDPDPAESSGWADAAVAQFRKRYPAEPTALKAAWYDEPPFEKDGTHHPCWVLGEDRPGMVYWGSSQWLVVRVGSLCPEQLNGRRVCPIAKPSEPPQ